MLQSKNPEIIRDKSYEIFSISKNLLLRTSK